MIDAGSDSEAAMQTRFIQRHSTKQSSYAHEVAELKEELRRAKNRIQELEEKWGAAMEYSAILEGMNDQLNKELKQKNRGVF